MSKLKSVRYGGKIYPVTFKQTRKWSHTTMKKCGMVLHATTSNSYLGGLNWMVDGWDGKTYGNGGSAHFIIGREVGQVAMLGELNQMLWHSGNIKDSTELFFAIAKLKEDNNFVNPNLYLDGIEFVGGVDEDGSGKVEHGEVNLTEWQYECADAIIRWHAEINDYKLEAKNIITHEDIYSGKPELEFVREEILFRLFEKDDEELWECQTLQEENVKLKGMVGTMISLTSSLLKLWRR